MVRGLYYDVTLKAARFRNGILIRLFDFQCQAGLELFFSNVDAEDVLFSLRENVTLSVWNTYAKGKKISKIIATLGWETH